MRTTFAAAIALVILQHPAYSIERMECGGTEPFWDAKLSDTQVIFALPSGKRGTIYPAPRYSAARNAPFVTSVMATRGRSTLIAFVVDERLMIIADKIRWCPSRRPWCLQSVLLRWDVRSEISLQHSPDCGWQYFYGLLLHIYVPASPVRLTS